MFTFIAHNFKHCVQNVRMNSNLTEFQKVRIIMKQKKLLKKIRPKSTHFSAKLKIIGSGAVGVPSCIILETDHVNYLFNCGEVTQRLCQEHHCKLSKLGHIFLTSVSWKNIGGLPGLLLTAESNGLQSLKIHSPKTVRDIISQLKFIHLKELEVSNHEANAFTPYTDNIMNMWYVPLTKTSKNTSNDVINENQCYSNENNKRVIDDEITENKCVHAEKKVKNIPDVTCYICEIHPKRGKVLVDKCLQYGIMKYIKKLQEGEDVTRDDGTVIHAADVCEPDSPKTIFIVVECPTEEYLDSLVNHPTFLKYQETTSTEPDNEVFCIFHFTPEEIFNDQRYKDWIKRFSADTQHIILNDENTCMGSEAVYKNQYLLHMLHPEIFPLLPKNCFKKNTETQNNNIHRAKTMQTFLLRPKVESMITSDIYKEPSTYIETVYKIPEFEGVLNKLKTNINEKTTELDLTNISEYPRILMLGTGCSTPNKVRNTSGILIRINKDNSILLDCGEGTLGQIIRYYGASEANNVLCTIKGIYTSHIHADHHLGLISLLLRRKRVTTNKLYLFASKNMQAWLNYYNMNFESISEQYQIVDSHDLYLNSHVLPSHFEALLYKYLGIKEINTIFVRHCKHSYGIAITLKDNTKIVYSGDTMFCENLITLANNCDLLIHEATMADGLESLAKLRLHSTTSDAINVGKRANAKFVLLTHFSQRYSKIPTLSEGETNVGLAYDHMEFKLPQLPLLPLFYPCLKVMFHQYAM